MNQATDQIPINIRGAARECGPCTACCKGWLKTEVNGVPVGIGKPCRYSKKSGCAIYETRPQYPCRDFICGWLRWDSTLPDWMRPSECGAIVFLWFDWQGQKVINAVPVGDKIPKQTLDWLMAHAQEQGRPLMFVEHLRESGKYVGAKCLGFGPPLFVKKVETIKLAHEQAELMRMFSSPSS